MKNMRFCLQEIVGWSRPDSGPVQHHSALVEHARLSALTLNRGHQSIDNSDSCSVLSHRVLRDMHVNSEKLGISPSGNSTTQHVAPTRAEGCGPEFLTVHSFCRRATLPGRKLKELDQQCHLLCTLCPG